MDRIPRQAAVTTAGTRRRFLALAGSALAAPALLREGHAQAAEVRLRLHHFLPPASVGHSRFLAPWTQKVERDSGGRIRITIFPSMQLGGSLPQLFDQVRDGVVDLVWTVPSATPGRFPGLEVLELPFVAHRRARVNARAAQEYFEAHLRHELREVKPIAVWAHDHGVIHANRPVRRLEDLAGMKIRFPTRPMGEALRALGASPIGMPIPQVAESLATNVIDGTVIPWEVVPALRVQELVRNHTEIPGSPTLYSATLLLAMNPARYEALPAELREVIDRNSGMAAASLAGAVWDEHSLVVSEMVRRRGNMILALAEDEVERWRAATRPVVENWVATSRERNIDGARLLEAARAALAKAESET